MFILFSKRLSQKEAARISELLLRFVQKSGIDPRLLVINVENIFNKVVDDSDYADYRIESEEIKAIVRQTIDWLHNHEPAAKRLHEFHTRQKHDYDNGLMVSYSNQAITEMREFLGETPMLDTVAWRGK